MVDVPAEVQYGKVIGRFVSFVADSNDPGTVPDEVPLTGTVTITPNTPLMRFINTDPPRTAVISILECPVINGDLYAPNSSTPGVWMMASEQPAGQPDHVQFTARFNFNELSGLAQPQPVVFEVPAGGTLDLAMAMGVDPDPGTVVVVSTEGVARVEEIYQDIQDIINGGGIIMGDDGREVELRNSGTAIQWRYVDTPEQSWTDLILNSELIGPPGADGEDGAPGSPGAKGDKGDAGTPGDKLTMGTITTGAPGTEALASITGASPNKVLDLTIPRGDKGEKGDQGDAGLDGTTLPSLTQSQIEAGTSTTKSAITAAVFRSAANALVESGIGYYRDEVFSAPICQLTKTTSQTGAAGVNSPTALSFDVKTLDIGGMHSAEAPTRITAPRDGWYRVTAKGAVQLTGLNYMSIAIAKNGVQVPHSQVTSPGPAGGYPRQETTLLIPLSTNDYVEAYLACSVASANLSVVDCLFEAEWIRPL